MEYTTFNKELWNLTLFDTIGYSKEQSLLKIQFFDGTSIECEQIDEASVFNFILAENKEEYFYEILKHKAKK